MTREQAEEAEVAEDLKEQLAIAHRTRDGLATRAEKAEAEVVRLRERIATLESHLSDAHHHLAEAHRDNDALRRENTELREKLTRAYAALGVARKDAPDATAP